ncbi:MAG TPA: NAD(P)H-binding protein [Kribbellaceae bacterium]|nr:NAD(P)H-binding protein [Kribbellaceae bacterium]
MSPPTMRRKRRSSGAPGLDWTIVRPPRLTNGPKTGVYQHGETIHATQVVPRISRADVADFVLTQLTDPTYLHRAPAVMPGLPG